MKQQENKLKVKYSTFESNLSFNEWAQKLQVSTLAPHVVEPYEKKLDNYNEHEKRQMISSVMSLTIVAPELDKQRVI
jgi:hypothetical protein